MVKKRFKNSKFASINIIIIYCVLLVLLTIFLFLTEPSINLNKFEIEECQNPIFEYDKIEYYTLEVNNFDSELLNSNDTLKRRILNDYFTNINDSLNVIHIENYYKKNELDLKTLKFIRSFVCVSKKNINNEFSECIPIFRDVMVFKNKSKIVGILKICFECNLSNLVSTEFNSPIYNNEKLDILEQLLIENKNASNI